MLISALLLAASLATPSTTPVARSPRRDDAPATVYSGRAGQTAVKPPRLDVTINVDGSLDEPAWKQAAVLTGFSQFSPQDGIASVDSTEVLVWYSPTAIHFGIRAFEPHGAVRATLAQRDKIQSDDYIQLLLGTFNDGRQASVFMVNPMGVQADGVLKEGANVQDRSFGGHVSREAPDLAPDFVFQSAGKVQPWGYEVEVRIPFKSLKYQSLDVQTWGINVTRVVQHSGYEDSWAPAKRANASFLAQSGRLDGLTDLRRGLVLDFTPELTDRVEGSGSTGAWKYSAKSPELGGNVRWGITNNLTLNGTVNPDFSQVEADAGQFAYDPRIALSYPEKRPFFLDGSEQFATQNGLVYTRRIVQPVAAAKVTGKVGSSNIGLLSAVDDPTYSLTGKDRPIYNILRVSRDLGEQGRVGMLYTDRIEGDMSNRVAEVETRLVRNKIYSATLQGAFSRTDDGKSVRTGPLWDVALRRNGRRLAMTYRITAMSPDFITKSGFIARNGEAHAILSHHYTIFGKPGSLIESWTPGVDFDGSWFYNKLLTRGDIRDKKFHVNNDFALRGGWSAAVNYFWETFGYDPGYYGNMYRIAKPRAGGGIDTLPFTGVARLPNHEYAIQLNTPQWQRFSASAFLLQGQDENFYEWSAADIYFANVNVTYRPSEKARIGLSYMAQGYYRRTDGSKVAEFRDPRLRLEYQVSRALFVRVIGEYVSNTALDLRDDSRTGYPLLRRAGNGWERALGFSDNNVRVDWLVSYQPQPGTVFYVGYGAQMTEPESFRGDHLLRTNDALFVKASYLFRR